MGAWWSQRRQQQGRERERGRLRTILATVISVSSIWSPRPSRGALAFGDAAQAARSNPRGSRRTGNVANLAPAVRFVNRFVLLKKRCAGEYFSTPWAAGVIDGQSTVAMPPLDRRRGRRPLMPHAGPSPPSSLATPLRPRGMARHGLCAGRARPRAGAGSLGGFGPAERHPALLGSASSQRRPAGCPGGPGHCKGCPHNPVIGGPPVLATAVASPAESHVALPPVQQDGRHPLFATGLPPSRAPPAS